MDNYGFQSTQLNLALEILEFAKENSHKIAISFTGNIISSGLRSLIVDLAKARKLDFIVTSGAGVEEDIIKTFEHFEIGCFEERSEKLISKSKYRTGNLYISHKAYDDFYGFMDKNYEIALETCKSSSTPGEISKALGYIRGCEDSFLYWCYKHDINVYCPTFHDGAIGDFLVEYRKANPEHRIDYLYEGVDLTKKLLETENCGVIVLGGGTSKHFSYNNCVERGGYDWSIVISTATHLDGSDSGGTQDEAKTWGKIKTSSKTAHIFSEATLVFPFLAKALLNP